jgi:hypothetical protein
MTTDLIEIVSSKLVSLYLHGFSTQQSPIIQINKLSR